MELSREQMRELLRTVRTIAVVGLSDKPDRPSHEVASYLQQAGYRIIPVNPKIAKTLGETAYPSLRTIPERVDVVQIFRRPDTVPAVVEDAIAIGAKVVWMQPGAENESAATRARGAGLTAVVGACLRTVHRTLSARMGGQAG
jgi:predicted CoA-binding protein